MELFYSQDFGKKTSILDEQESHHCVKVLRKSIGDIIFVTNGEGIIYQCKIADPHPKHCALHILSQQESQTGLPAKICMAVAPTKQIDRFEWFLEKAVELGVTEVIPMLSDHSERKVIKSDRLQQIMVSAMKQSLSGQLPLLHPLTDFRQVLSIAANYPTRLIAYCGASNLIPIYRAIPSATDTILLIGPEGDFSETEYLLATTNQLTGITLGTRRLRTETAALNALQYFHFLNPGF